MPQSPSGKGVLRNGCILSGLQYTNTRQYVMHFRSRWLKSMDMAVVSNTRPLYLLCPLPLRAVSVQRILPSPDLALRILPDQKLNVDTSWDNRIECYAILLLTPNHLMNFVQWYWAAAGIGSSVGRWQHLKI